MLEQIRFIGPLPYHAQVASPELAGQFFAEGRDPQSDPNWRRSGAQSPAEYAYWVERACGVVCVQMCAEAFGGAHRSMVEWAHRGQEIGGYLIVDEDGKPAERGWIHGKLAELLRAEEIPAYAGPASLQDMAAVLRGGGLLICSVSYELGFEGPVTFKGGHLVVVRGMDIQDGEVITVYINNPSGRKRELQENAPIPAARFLEAYTGRVIVVGCEQHKD